MIPVEPVNYTRAVHAYLEAAADAGQALDDALAQIRAQQDDGLLSPADCPAVERVGLLERHLAESRRLRRDLLGEA